MVAWEMGSKLVVITTAVLVLLYFSGCSATVYVVGGNSGWDISTDLDSWAKDKTFAAGDTLLFQYSQYHSVSEVTEENYKGCNTSNVIQSSSNGNASFALTGPGDRYFVCGNRLHCLGGMKLHAHVISNQTAMPIGAPQAQAQPQPQPGGSLPRGSSKNNNPSSSASFLNQALLLPLFGFCLITLTF